jgi:hypothetical protein
MEALPMEIPNSNRLPKPTRSKRRGKTGGAATQAERDAIQFEAIKAEFNWQNDEWAATFLPFVRIAAVVVRGDRKKTLEFMREAAQSGDAPNFLEGLTRTKLHLEALHKLLDTALMRSYLTLEQLGYSPDNPPKNVVPLRALAVQS